MPVLRALEHNLNRHDLVRRQFHGDLPCGVGQPIQMIERLSPAPA